MSDNQVLLRGRVRHAPEQRDLPSGSPLVTVRLVIPREVSGAERPGSDWIDCTAWLPRVQHQVRRWREGDQVEVRGALRRRFYRNAAGTTGTTVEIAVLGGKVLKRSPEQAQAG